MVAASCVAFSSLAALVACYRNNARTMALRPCLTCLSRSVQNRKNAASSWFAQSSSLERSSGTAVLSRRWMGSRVEPGNPPGDVYIEDNQKDLQIDLDRLRRNASRIRSALGYDTYDLSILLVNDREMKETNRETRNVNAPTDILSFPFHPAIKPGVLVEPDFDIPDYYNLGDLLIDPAYVMRRCAEDAGSESSVDDSDADDDDNDRGVSGAMAGALDPEDRINMLLVHGILHLLGYDHEDDDEYEEMVTAEERLLNELNMLGRENE